MKSRFNKIVIPTLAICLGAALAGSISGTVAWYQYSTRASTAYLGTTAGTAGNLKLRIKGSASGEWLNSLKKEDISAYLLANNIGQDLIPVTAGNVGADDAIPMYDAAANPGVDPADMKPRFFKNPIRSFDETVPYSSGSWLKADQSMYVQIPLELCFIEFDGEKVNDIDKEYLEKDVYISDLLIQEDYQNSLDPEDVKKDLSSAIRVHVSSYRDDDDSQDHADTAFDRLISKDGGSILTRGYLDLDGDNIDDAITSGSDAGAAYGFGQNNQSKKIVYGEGIQTAYKAGKVVEDGSYVELDETVVNEKIYPAVVKSVGNSVVLDENDFEYTKEGASEATEKKIGTTIGYKGGDANYEQEYLNVVLTIWLEGWQTLPAPTDADPDAVSAIWNAADYIGSMFDVGITFAVQAE